MGRHRIHPPVSRETAFNLLRAMYAHDLIVIRHSDTEAARISEILDILEGEEIVSPSEKVHRRTNVPVEYNGNYLTDAQKRIVAVIANANAENLPSPTLDEIAYAVRTSKPAVQNHVTKLLSWGVLTRQPGKARTLKVTDAYLNSEKKEKPN